MHSLLCGISVLRYLYCRMSLEQAGGSAKAACHHGQPAATGSCIILITNSDVFAAGSGRMRVGAPQGPFSIFGWKRMPLFAAYDGRIPSWRALPRMKNNDTSIERSFIHGPYSTSNR